MPLGSQKDLGSRLRPTLDINKLYKGEVRVYLVRPPAIYWKMNELHRFTYRQRPAERSGIWLLEELKVTQGKQGVVIAIVVTSV